MNRQLSESTWLNDGDVCRIEYLAEVSGLSIEEIDDLVEIGVIAPAEAAARPMLFELCHVLTVKRARRLRDDFQLDPHGVALALTLIQRISDLQAELEALRAGRLR